MSAKSHVKLGVIICQECEEVIDSVDSRGVKKWYGKCQECRTSGKSA